MERADSGLSFLLQYDNIARYENGVTFILDRRVYPTAIEFVRCENHAQVAKAIADMVTQSAGPYVAASIGMAQAAYECRHLSEEAWHEYMQSAANTLSTARPTTQARMRIITGNAFVAAVLARKEGKDPICAILEHTLNTNNIRYNRVRAAAKNLLDIVPHDFTALTHCFGETIIGMLLLEASLQNRRPSLICSETRPYFQGARLTASVAHDMGADVTVITDNMVAAVMERKRPDFFTTAADLICQDGHVINKTGTFQAAIVARHFGTPYFVTGAPDYGFKTVESVTIEEREPTGTLYAMGVRTAMEGVKGFYPSFDITPPELVSAVITDLGVYSPYDLSRYHKEGGNEQAFLV